MLTNQFDIVTVLFDLDQELYDKAIEGKVLLNKVKPIPERKIFQNLTEKWDLTPRNMGGGSKHFSFKINEDTVLLNFIGNPIDRDEIENDVKDAYLWENIEKEVYKHKAQIHVALISKDENPIERHTLFTKIICAILDETDAAGIYLEWQLNLHSKKFYLKHTREAFDKKSLPIFNWIYFENQFHEDGTTSIFTYGLHNFDRYDLEIVDSKLPKNSLVLNVYSLVLFQLVGDTSFEDGDVFDVDSNFKCRFELSEPEFLELETLKIVDIVMKDSDYFTEFTEVKEDE